MHPVGAVAASGDGRLLTTTADSLIPNGLALTVVDALGATTRLSRAPVTGGLGGDGGALVETPWQPPRSMAVAADGSLLFLTSSDRLRAAVPAASPRPRVALDSTTRSTLRQGRVAYRAGVAGRVVLELRTGGALVKRTSARTAGGESELLLAPAPPPGVYDLRLRLQTGTAASESRGRVYAVDALPGPVARAAITRAYAVPASEETAGEATEVGRCAPLDPAVVQCVLMLCDLWTGQWWGERRPSALARATLGTDGVLRMTREPIKPLPPIPELRARVSRTQRAGARPVIRARVVSSIAARATVRVRVLRPAAAGARAVRELAESTPWHVALPLPFSSALVRRLATREPVIIRVEISLATPAGPADATTRSSYAVRLEP